MANPVSWRDAFSFFCSRTLCTPKRELHSFQTEGGRGGGIPISCSPSTPSPPFPVSKCRRLPATDQCCQGGGKMRFPPPSGKEHSHSNGGGVGAVLPNFPPRSRSQSRRKVVDETFLKLHLDEPTVFSLRPHLGKRSRSALVKKRKWGKPFQPCQVKEKGTAATSNEERKAEEEGETDNYRYTPPIR